jgi:hypothetical protein
MLLLDKIKARDELRFAYRALPEQVFDPNNKLRHASEDLQYQQSFDLIALTLYQVFSTQPSTGQ